MALIADFVKALGQIGDRRFLMVLAKALALTIALLFALAALMVWLSGFIPTDLGTWWLIGKVELPSIGLKSLAVGAVVLASPFLMIPVAAIFVGLFLEEIADAVEDTHYPGLPEARPVGIVESTLTALKFLGAVILVNLIALIPYLVFMLVAGPLVVLLVYGVNGYLLGREYFELVAARRVPPAEVARLRRRHFGAIWFAGVCMAVPLTIPVMNLVIPVLGVATVTHQFHRLRGVG